MLKKPVRLYLLAIGLGGALLTASMAQAQTATVRGFVTDASNGEALQGVNVVVETPTPFGAATDSDGLYVVAGLTPGRYVLRASFIGFRTYVDTLRLAPRDVTHPTQPHRREMKLAAMMGSQNGLTDRRRGSST